MSDPLVSFSVLSLVLLIDLDCAINRCSVDASGHLLVVGDVLGGVHFVHIPSREVFYSQGLFDDEIVVLEFFIMNNTSELLVMAKSGSTFRFSGIPFLTHHALLVDQLGKLAVEVIFVNQVEIIY